jgi:hypothetical protein
MRSLVLFILSFVALPLSSSAATLTTTYAGGNGQAGAMFDVTNISGSGILLLGTFDTNLYAATADSEVAVYYRTGTYVGFESTAVGWTLLGSDFVTSLGDNTPTPFDVGNTLLIGAGQTYGFLVTLTERDGSNGMNYTDGANVYSDGTLQVTAGVGKAVPLFTGGTFSPRTWNGSIDYEAAVSGVPEPTTWTLLLGGVLVLSGMRSRRAMR